jgi:predicted site-specific integrase-resolvase
MAEKFPVQEQVDDQKGSKYQARVIVYGRVSLQPNKMT